jgi:hypothetical protein
MYSKYLKEWMRAFPSFGIYNTELCSQKINVHVKTVVNKEMIQLILSFLYNGNSYDYVLRIGCICECASITPLHLFMDFYFPGKSWTSTVKKVMYPSQMQKIFYLIIRDIFHTANRYVGLYGNLVQQKIKVRLAERRKKYASYSNFIMFSAYELIITIKYSNDPYEVYSIPY